MDEIIDMMRKDIDISVERSASGNQPLSFRIKYRALDPVLAAKVVDRITSLYIAENVRDREVQSADTAAFLESQLRDAKRTLDEQEAAVSRYKVEHNGELPEQQNTLLAALARFQLELEGNQDALSRAEQTRVTLESGLAAGQMTEAALRSRIHAAAVASAIGATATDPSSTVPESVRLKSQLELTRLRYGDMHPDVRRLQDQLQAALAREKAAGSVTARMSPSAPQGEDSGAEIVDPDLLRAHEHTVDLKTQLAAIRQEIERRNHEVDRIKRDIASYEQRIERLPVREQDYAALTRDYDFSKANYRGLLDKKMAAEMSSDLEKRQKSDWFRILDAARPPEKPLKSKRKMLYGVSFAGGLFLGMLVAIAFEMRRGVLLGEWELPNGTPVIARIPTMAGVIAYEASAQSWRALLGSGSQQQDG
jgi:uncharacterized protein involved in exopolysaccharide biosynthesis